MITFSITSVLLLLGYISVLANASEMSAVLLAACAVDLFLLTTMASAYFIRTMPLALLTSCLGVVICAEIADFDAQRKVYALIGQVFICLVFCRLYARRQHRPLSSTLGSWLTLYAPLGVKPGTWEWTERFNAVVDRGAAIIDKLSLFILPVGIVCGPFTNGYSFVAVVIAYSLVWLVYLALVVTPLLVAERIGRFIFSMSHPTPNDKTTEPATERV